MTSTLNGAHFYSLIEYGIANLSANREKVNDLNVFPVPDGDTGTNMVLTLESGFTAIQGREDSPLPALARRFSDAVVFGARGNSGVIISQFFKGFSEGFYSLDEADPDAVCAAMERGVSAAYRAVAKPVEGTILTVLREATASLRSRVDEGQMADIDCLIDAFLKRARVSLEHTPDLLPILKSAGVVDSGGAGIIYVFEGMKKYLKGDPLPKVETGAAPAPETVDYTAFGPESSFELGYCTEVLIQQTVGAEQIGEGELRAALEELGDSVVTAFRSQKIKVHVHTKHPESVLALCHRFGEFLSLKIENMSVQHSERESAPPQRIRLTAADRRSDRLSVIAVAHDPTMQERFLEMGADAVITCDRHTPPAASDFLEAFEKVDAPRMLIFPNNGNTAFAAMQAIGLYGKGDLTVFPTTSDAQCYAALPMVDFAAEDTEGMIRELRETVDNVRAISMTRAEKPSVYGDVTVTVGALVAMEGHLPYAVSEELSDLLVQTAKRMLSQKEGDVLTLFINPTVREEDLAPLEQWLAEDQPYAELTVVPTEDSFWLAVLSVE